MIVGIDPKVDYAFKHVFGREETRLILIDLLDGVLDPGPDRRIRDVELLNPFNPKESLDDKLSILDIKARDQSGRQFNVEMQMLRNRYFKSRIVYYQSKFHQQQLHEGEDYSALMPTISIVFLNEVLFPERPDYHFHIRMLEEQHHFPFAGDLEIHTLELPKFLKTEAELTTGLDIWLYFLRHAEKMDSEALPKALDRPLVRRALEELIMLSQSDLERERYEARRKFQLDYTTGMKGARLEGVEEGVAEGVVQGLAKGQKIGEIHLCERMLHRPETPTEQLQRLSLEELTRLAEEHRTLALGKR